MKRIIRLISFVIFFYLIAETTVAQTGFSKVYYNGSIHAGTVTKTYDKAYVIAGITYNDYENILIKTDSLGNLVWNKVLKKSSADIFSNVISLSDSSLLLVTNYYSDEQSHFNLLCLKFDTNGDTLWLKSVDMGKSLTPYSVEQTTDDGFIITGVVGDDVSPKHRIAILKFDLDGHLQWSKKIYAGNHSNYGYAVKQTVDTGFIITGFIENLNPFSSFAYLMKLSVLGEIMWSKIYHLESSERSMGFDVELLDDSFLLLMGDGYFIHILKTDLVGNVLWGKQYEYSSDVVLNLPAIKIQKTSDTNFVLLVPDALIKIDTNGVPVWSKNLVMNVADFVVSPDNGFFVVGNGPIFGVKNQSIDYPHIGVIKTDKAGHNTSSCIIDYAYMNARDTTIIGESVGFELDEYGSSEPMKIEFSTSNILVDTGCVSFIGNTLENQIKNGVSIYPNPSTGKVNIQMEDGLQLTELDVYDALGTKLFHTNSINSTCMIFNLNTKQPGLYMIKMKVNDIIIFRKILIY